VNVRTRRQEGGCRIGIYVQECGTRVGEAKLECPAATDITMWYDTSMQPEEEQVVVERERVDINRRERRGARDVYIECVFFLRRQPRRVVV
jgi:hypothetical protein